MVTAIFVSASELDPAQTHLLRALQRRVIISSQRRVASRLIQYTARQWLLRRRARLAAANNRSARSGRASTMLRSSGGSQPRGLVPGVAGTGPGGAASTSELRSVRRGSSIVMPTSALVVVRPHGS